AILLRTTRESRLDSRSYSRPAARAVGADGLHGDLAVRVAQPVAEQLRCAARREGQAAEKHGREIGSFTDGRAHVEHVLGRALAERALLVQARQKDPDLPLELGRGVLLG